MKTAHHANVSMAMQYIRWLLGNQALVLDFARSIPGTIEFRIQGARTEAQFYRYASDINTKLQRRPSGGSTIDCAQSSIWTLSKFRSIELIRCPDKMIMIVLDDRRKI